MQGGLRLAAISLFLLLTAAYLPCKAVDTQDGNENHLINKIQVNHAGERYNKSWVVQSGDYYSIQSNCLACNSTLLLNGVELANDQQNLAGMITQNGTLELVIENPNLENFTPANLIGVSDTYAATRPSPSSPFDLQTPYKCDVNDDCIDSNSPLLTTERSAINNDEGRITLGVTANESPNYIGFAVYSGETIEFSLEHSSADIVVEAYFQNSSTEITLGEFHSSFTVSNFDKQPNVKFTNFNQEGRLILKISSATPNTVWAIGVIAHETHGPRTVDLASSQHLCGHQSATLIITNNDTTALIFTAENYDVNYSYESLVESSWLSTGSGVFSSGVERHIFPLPSSNAIRLIIDAPVFCLQASSISFGDASSGIEAPSLPPILSTTNNSSWPQINVFDTTTTGEFTHSIRDTSDVYRIEIDAWEDSVHFIMLELTGDINQFEIELIEKNQEDWSESQSKVKTTSLGKLSVAMEVSRGTHFFRVSIINNSADTSWGDFAEPTKYSIISTYELVDEGEEPWFPPDENAKKWGNIARWFMGILLLAPAAYLGISQIRKKSYAQHMLTKQQRLDWLRNRLDSGISPRKNRRDLAKSLDAVATLDWEEACNAWGEPDLLYRTENVAIACWKLDQRISKESDAWPIIVGVYIIDGNWEIAALRFDSPEGKAWQINSVTPRFLFSGYEVFLDTMNSGNKTFISVELTGDASSVDIELNGRMDGQPYACRAAKSLLRGEEE
ncbi:MAG: hypothetical protein VX483_05370 [Candidatus Thermoplasmatota archaeon]|nr:hypothetical protein [Candidatus Thermoplasmatota archaeon]